MKKKFRVSRFDFRIMNNENVRLVVLLAAAVVGIVARAVTVTYDGRFMDASGNIQSNTTINATIRAYAAADSADALSDEVQITFSTDAEGYFSISTSELWIPPDCNTFWVGVTPDGYGEIAPRMRVSPAPFAIRAAQARALEVDGEFKVEGTAEITTLSNAKIANINTLIATNSLLMNSSVNGMGTLYAGRINLQDSGRLSLFRAGSSGWTQLMKLSIYAFQRYKNEANSFTPTDDGILVMRVWVDTSSYDDVSLNMRIYNGDVYSYDGEDFSIGDSSKKLPISSKDYIYFTFPVRKDKKVSVDATLRTGSMWYTPDAYIEYKCFYAGVE